MVVSLVERKAELMAELMVAWKVVLSAVHLVAWSEKKTAAEKVGQ
jgi:hypothetical protein